MFLLILLFESGGRVSEMIFRSISKCSNSPSTIILGNRYLEIFVRFCRDNVQPYFLKSYPEKNIIFIYLYGKKFKLFLLLKFSELFIGSHKSYQETRKENNYENFNRDIMLIL